MWERITKKISIFLLVLSIVFANTLGVFANTVENIVEGFLVEMGENQVTVEEYDGTVRTFPFNSYYILRIDTLNVDSSDFKPGMEIYLKLQNNKVSFLEGFSTVSPGHIPEGSKVRIGTIKKIDRDQLIVKLDSGQEETYFTSPATILLRDGLKVPLSSLYEGDMVKFYFDEIDSKIISRMSVQGKSIEVKGLYKGKLALADVIKKELTLTDLKIFRNGGWENLTNSKTISYDESSPIHIGGQKISEDKLKYYKDNTVYLAVKDYFSSDRIESMVLESQNEAVYIDTIENINWFGNSMELEVSHRNLTFNEGTIVVKNGRLSDINSLDAGMDIFIVGDGTSGTMSANIIYVYNEGINNSNIGQNYIYEGRLDAVFRNTNTIMLKDFAYLNNNSWEAFNNSKELYYDEDTIIYDFDEKRILSSEEFYYGDYAIDEDSRYAQENSLEDRYAYLYTEGDRVIALMVQKNRDSLLKQRITNGVALEAPENHKWTGWRINIANAADWSSRKGQWMARKDSFYITLEDAIIIKNGRIIGSDQLNKDDRLYIVREDLKAKVIIVK